MAQKDESHIDILSEDSQKTSKASTEEDLPGAAFTVAERAEATVDASDSDDGGEGEDAVKGGDANGSGEDDDDDEYEEGEEDSDVDEGDDEEGDDEDDDATLDTDAEEDQPVAKKSRRLKQHEVDGPFISVGSEDGEDDEPLARKRSPRTMRELMAMSEDDYEEDDDDSDESDWEPMEAVPRWYCVNCTMENRDLPEVTHCRLCSEHRNSGILHQGHHAVAEEEWIEGQGSMSEPVSGPTNMATATMVSFDPRMLLHEEFKSQPHPERPDRLRAIMGGLAMSGLFPGRCLLLPPREASRSELEAVHTCEHVDRVEATADREVSYFTSDTYANQFSNTAARLAAGCCVDLAVAIATGKCKNGVALVRPPGHHAETVNVMGFCLHNNAAVAARAAQAAGARKILILDWDVHHGNGVQQVFEQDPTVLYMSIHRFDGGLFYPGTGAAAEVGSGEGEGFCVNVPWSSGGVADNDYMAAFKHVIMPIGRQFCPDMVIVSAGFDAAAGDPLGACEVTPPGYAHMTEMLASLVNNKVLVVLEGGYNLRSISASVSAVTAVLLGDPAPPLPKNLMPSDAGMAAISEVCSIQAHFWPGLEVPPHPLHLQEWKENGVVEVGVADQVARMQEEFPVQDLKLGGPPSTGVASSEDTSVAGPAPSLGAILPIIGGRPHLASPLVPPSSPPVRDERLVDRCSTPMEACREPDGARAAVALEGQ